MPVTVTFPCPQCEATGRAEIPATAPWRCPACEHVIELPHDADEALPTCVVCGNNELYRKKDFPHGLGMAILVLACVASTITYARAERWATWAILIGSALFDGLLYLWVKDAIVCYRCGAHYRGLPKDTPHKPFELTVHERYRQERLRREQMKNGSM